MSAITKKSDTHQERYVHLVIEDHPRVKNATVFAREVAGHWAYSVSFCHKDDAFDRRIGRQVARRKFFASQAKTCISGPFEFHKAVEFAAEEAAKLTGPK